ncbi:MAG: hypothetical protein JWO38_8037 [Gemmataceae bacterium]|nr:hypothetical protein [Gemmataceae bacterium]
MPRRFFFRLLSDIGPTGDHVPDGDLLRRFVRERDPAALELLVRRHADAVWAACRGVLRSETDAEDAFQATFLVLARKAGTIRGERVGGWLHRVAVNAALKLRGRSARVAIATVEQLDALPAPAPADPDPDLSALVQEELAGLPERYRVPVVLCELEGHTHAEAANVLGWPIGTVSSRLSRARTLLRARLARRGVSAPAIVLPALGLPPALVRDTTAVAIGTAPVRPTVSTLTEGVLSMMRLAQYKLVAVGLVSVGLVALAGFGTFTALGQRPELPGTEPTTAPAPPNQKNQPAISPAGDSITAYPELDPKSLEDLVTNCPKTLGGKEIPLVPNEAPLLQLQKAKLNAALVDLSAIVDRLKLASLANEAPAIPEACNRAVAAAADLFASSELRPWFEERVRVAKWYEMVIDAQVKAGKKSPSDLNAARYARLDAEIALVKLTSRKDGGGGR